MQTVIFLPPLTEKIGLVQKWLKENNGNVLLMVCLLYTSGYADNSISQISIEACNDSIAYSIPRHLLTKLFDSSLGLANLGRRLIDVYKRQVYHGSDNSRYDENFSFF